MLILVVVDMTIIVKKNTKNGDQMVLLMLRLVLLYVIFTRVS